MPPAGAAALDGPQQPSARPQRLRKPELLDEIEAALDDANIGYYADFLKEFSKGTQFIVVTHRKGTMERCNSLYGVAMEEQGVSRMVSVSLQDYQD